MIVLVTLLFVIYVLQNGKWKMENILSGGLNG